MGLSEAEAQKNRYNAIKITYGRYTSPRVIKKKIKRAIEELRKATNRTCL